MNPVAMLHVTEKGADEIAQRNFGLSIRQRGMMLMLLGKPQTLESVLRKSLLPAEESLAIIRQLMEEGFIVQDAATAATIPATRAVPAGARPLSKAMAFGDEWRIDDEAILSEAKFLLANFCMDCFGTQAQKLIGRFRACKTADELSEQTRSLSVLVNQQQPGKLSALRDIVRTINENA